MLAESPGLFAERRAASLVARTVGQLPAAEPGVARQLGLAERVQVAEQPAVRPLFRATRLVVAVLEPVLVREVNLRQV